MGPFSCIKRNKEKKANHSRMPCTNCMAEYTLRRKEHGCSKCGFGFCERCVSHRFVIPALSPKPVPVCASCYHLLTNKKDADEKPILARREKSREFPLPTTMSDNDNSWGDDRLPPPSLRSLYPQQQQRQPKRANGGGGGGDEKWADLEARLARLNDPNQFEQPAPEQSATSKGGKNQREPTKKEPAPPIEELEERLAALRGIPVDLVRKPRLLVMSEDDDDVSDVVLNDEAAQLLRKAELGYPVTSGCGGGRNAAGMQDDMSTNSNNSESSSVLQNVIADALKAPSARSSTSELSKMATSDQPLYPSFAECIRRTLEDAKAAEHEAMEFIRRHEAAPQNPGPRTDTKHEHKPMSSSASPDIREECVRVFRRRFGRPPQWLVRCPGRVNLIGEHIDYSDYSVLPMAIEDSTWVAVGTCPKREIQLENVDGTKYAPFALPIPSDSFASACAEAGTTPKWHHYFLAGWRGILEHLGEMGQSQKNEAEALRGAHGMCAVVGSRIPPSAGLSSSSALVCAAALATLCVQTDGQTFDRVSKSDLAEIATRAERFVGVEGGGMDQACECLAREDQALRIDFRPLRWSPVKLPPGALFAVLHSGKEMNKAASTYYNQRVVECRIAAQLIAKRSGCCGAGSEWHTVRTLKQAAHLLGKADHPDQMLALVDQHLQLDYDERAHTRAECCAALGCTDAELARWSLNTNTQDMREFWLAKRARHVYSEAARVLDFERACRENAAEALQRMAALMNASHASCAQLFECSCAELDAMVEACRRAGFAGARLTGAGWGGCVVALVDKAQRAKVEASGEVKVLFWSEPCEGIEAHAYAEEAEKMANDRMIGRDS